EKVYPEAQKVRRYAIKKKARFDCEALKKNLQMLPDGYELKNIDENLYDKCMENPETAEFVSVFESKEKYLKEGRGVVIIKDGKIVSGASSYTRYREGIEIEVSTAEAERRKHLAMISCSALIIRCLEDGLYPSWDAHNMNSVHLAEKLGYEFDHEYIAYEIAADARTH
ncbi:MAG: GNAT family N-acetyltransferase, partial [Lachnospiraceae bacterium]|nr:GNAT family N-acetyltransferase [Lachnospiraceae bacterium]